MELVEPTQDTPKDAPLSLKAQLEAEQAAQREAFTKELEELMARYNIAFTPTFTIGDQQVAITAIVNFPVSIQVVSK